MRTTVLRPPIRAVNTDPMADIDTRAVDTFADSTPAARSPAPLHCRPKKSPYSKNLMFSEGIAALAG